MTPLVQHREVSLPPCADADVTAIFASLFGFLGLLLATSLFSRARAYELSILLASALAAGGFWIFIEIAEEMLEGETRRLDEAILLSLHNSAALVRIEEVMRDFTSLGGTAILVALCLAILGDLLLQKKRGMALFMAAAVIGGFILSSTLKRFFDRPRPDIVPTAPM